MRAANAKVTNAGGHEINLIFNSPDPKICACIRFAIKHQRSLVPHVPTLGKPCTDSHAGFPASRGTERGAVGLHAQWWVGPQLCTIQTCF